MSDDVNLLTLEELDVLCEKIARRKKFDPTAPAIMFAELDTLIRTARAHLAPSPRPETPEELLCDEDTHYWWTVKGHTKPESGAACKCGEKSWPSPRQQETPRKVDRVELIDHRLTSAEPGRVFVAYGCRVELSYQDAGRTLKVFVDDGADAAPGIETKNALCDADAVVNRLRLNVEAEMSDFTRRGELRTFADTPTWREYSAAVHRRDELRSCTADDLPSPAPAREPDESWDAYRAGYLNGVSTRGDNSKTYDEWRAEAEAGAKAYVAIMRLPLNNPSPAEPAEPEALPTMALNRVLDDSVSGWTLPSNGDRSRARAELRTLHTAALRGREDRERLRTVYDELEDAAVTMRNYYAQAISREVVERKLTHYRAAIDAARGVTTPRSGRAPASTEKA